MIMTKPGSEVRVDRRPESLFGTNWQQPAGPLRLSLGGCGRLREFRTQFNFKLKFNLHLECWVIMMLHPSRDPCYIAGRFFIIALHFLLYKSVIRPLICYVLL
jgi:hypothetical protein